MPLTGAAKRPRLLADAFVAPLVLNLIVLAFAGTRFYNLTTVFDLLPRPTAAARRLHSISNPQSSISLFRIADNGAAAWVLVGVLTLQLLALVGSQVWKVREPLSTRRVLALIVATGSCIGFDTFAVVKILRPPLNGLVLGVNRSAGWVARGSVVASPMAVCALILCIVAAVVSLSTLVFTLHVLNREDRAGA